MYLYRTLKLKLEHDKGEHEYNLKVAGWYSYRLMRPIRLDQDGSALVEVFS
jgi:hypothetical protein